MSLTDRPPPTHLPSSVKADTSGVSLVLTLDQPLGETALVRLGHRVAALVAQLAVTLVDVDFDPDARAVLVGLGHHHGPEDATTTVDCTGRARDAYAPTIRSRDVYRPLMRSSPATRFPAPI
jgi:hypothetical protein